MNDVETTPPAPDVPGSVPPVNEPIDVEALDVEPAEFSPPEEGQPREVNHVVAGVILGAIAAHLARHGPKNWRILTDQYVATGQVSERWFWRMVAQVKLGKPPQEILANAVKLARSRVARSLPVVVSPAYIAKAGASQARGNMDFLKKFDDLYRNAEELRESSSSIDVATGLRKIKNPMVFAMAIKLGRDLLDTGIRARKEILDLERVQRFLDMVMEEVANESPECRNRIMSRLGRLNDDFGFNSHMQTDDDDA